MEVMECFQSSLINATDWLLHTFIYFYVFKAMEKITQKEKHSKTLHISTLIIDKLFMVPLELQLYKQFIRYRMLIDSFPLPFMPALAFPMNGSAWSRAVN